MQGPVEARIAALRGRVRRLLALHGLSWLVAGTLAAVVAAGLADWLVHLAPEVRLALLLGVIGLAGTLLVRRVVLPLVVRFRDLDIALRIEERWPGLNDRLASTVQFLQASDGADEREVGSRALREATVQQTLEQIQGIDFREAVDPRPVRRALGWAAGAVGVVVLLLVADAGLVGIAAERLFHPYGSASWPRLTHLTVLPETPIKVARGMPFAVAVGIAPGERMPASAKITYRYENGETATESLRPTADRTFRGRIETVTQPFSFRVEAGDDLTDRRNVAVVPPPALTRTTVKLVPPPYTGLATQTLAPGNTQVRLVEGSRVEISADSNKPLRSASLRLGETTLPATTVQLAPGGGGLTASFVAKESKPFWFELLDTEGFKNQEIVRFDVRATRDEAPRVTVEDPAQDRDVPAGAVIPVRIAVEDDFGLHLVRLIYKVAAGGSEPTTEVVVPLWEGPAPGLSATNPVHKQEDVTYRWDLAPIPNLQPGSTVTFYADARDFDNLKGPNIGKSREIRLRIVSPDEIQRQLEDQQKAIHDEIERALAMQKQARTPVADALRTLDQNAKLNDAGKTQLRDAEMIQRQVSNRITSKADGIDAKIRRALDDMTNFKVDNPEAQRQMADLRDAVRQIREQNLNPAEQGLTQATKALDQPNEANDGKKPNEPNPATDPPRAGTNKPSPSDTDQTQPKGGAKGENPPDADQPQTKGGSKASDATNADPSNTKKPNEPNAGQEQPQAKGGSKKPNEPNADPANSKKPNEPNADPANSKKPNEPNSDSSPSRDGSKAASEPNAEPSPTKKPNEPNSDPAQSAGGTKKPNEPNSDQAPTQAGSPRAALADAEKNQKEIARKLEEMLAGMGKFNNARNLTREAKSLLQAQEKAMGKTTEAATPDTQGKPQDALTPEQKADRNNLAAAQNELSKQLQNLEAKLDEAAKALEPTDPLGAAGLRDAAEQSRKRQTSAKMSEGADQLDRNQMGQARENQQKAVDDLKALTDAIQNRREKELSHLVKELKAAEADLKKLRDRQAALNKKTADAKKNPDAAQRQEQLAKLAKEQKQVEEETKKQVQKLSKLSAETASRAGQQAAGQMSKASEKMEQGDGEQQAEAEQEEALQNLREAQKEVAAARREAEEQLASEQIVKMIDALKSIHERQDKMADETTRYEKTRTDADGKLTLAQRTGVRELGRVQAGLKDEAGELGDRLGEGAPVFRLTIKKAADGMETAAGRLQSLKTDEPTTQSQRLASLRLRQLLDSLKKEQAKKNGGQQGGEQGGQQGGQQGGGDGFPPAAQIKMLKMLQQEINERTEFFDELKRRGKELTPEQTAEVDQLEKDQGALADLVRDLTQPKQDDGED